MMREQNKVNRATVRKFLLGEKQEYDERQVSVRNSAAWHSLLFVAALLALGAVVNGVLDAQLLTLTHQNVLIIFLGLLLFVGETTLRGAVYSINSSKKIVKMMLIAFIFFELFLLGNLGLRLYELAVGSSSFVSSGTLTRKGAGLLVFACLVVIYGFLVCGSYQEYKDKK